MSALLSIYVKTSKIQEIQINDSDKEYRITDFRLHNGGS